jgi:hypothetical protein
LQSSNSTQGSTRLQFGKVANQMLEHLEAILELRRKRGLFIEERHAAGWKWGHSSFPFEAIHACQRGVNEECP